MPRITTADVSNHDEASEPAGYVTQHGTFEPHWPPKHRVSVSAPDAVSVIQSPVLSLPPKSAPKADHVAYAVQELGVPQGDAEGMTVRDLVAMERPGESGEDEEDEEAEEGGDQPSAGTSSLTSASKPEKTGSSAPATEQSTRSPAPDAENPSVKGQATKPARSSSASSTDTSSQGTGASRQSRSGFSEESTGRKGATEDPGDPK